MTAIGYTFRPEYLTSILQYRGDVDFLEIVPDGVSLGDNPGTKALDELAALFPFTAHSLNLSIASANDQMLHHQLDAVLPVLERLKVLNYSDHLSFTRAGHLNCDAYIPPVYRSENIKALVSRIAIVRDRISETGASFSLETVANILTSNRDDVQAEGRFLTSLHEACGINFILNVDSLLITADNHGCEPADLLESYPANAISALTIVPPDGMNIVMNDQYGTTVHDSGLDILECVADRFSPERVVIQVRYPENTLHQQIGYVRSIRDRIAGVNSHAV